MESAFNYSHHKPYIIDAAYAARSTIDDPAWRIAAPRPCRIAFALGRPEESASEAGHALIIARSDFSLLVSLPPFPAPPSVRYPSPPPKPLAPLA
jgi:hypothetical protein